MRLLPTARPAHAVALLVIVALGGMVTLAAMYVAFQPRPTYWSDTNVHFLSPPDPDQPNTYAFTSSGVIATAGAVARMIDPDASHAGVGTQTTLLAEGVDEGYLVRLPNQGSQWQAIYDRPLLEVQVIGPDPERVREQADRLVTAIGTQLDELQADVPAPSRITITHTPSAVRVVHDEGDRKRAVLGTLLIDVVLTFIAAVRRDRLAGFARRLTRPISRGSGVSIPTTHVPL